MNRRLVGISENAAIINQPASWIHLDEGCVVRSSPTMYRSAPPMPVSARASQTGEPVSRKVTNTSDPRIRKTQVTPRPVHCHKAEARASFADVLTRPL